MPPDQFERVRASADEMEQYLKAAADGAKEAEARALAKADEGKGRELPDGRVS